MTDSKVGQELAWIRGLMADSRTLLHGTWQHQVLWGVLSIAGLLGTWWARGAGRLAWVPLGWLALIAFGWVASAILGRRLKAKSSVGNQAQSVFAGVWIGVGATLTVLGTIGLVGGAIPPAALPGVVAVVIGSGYFASGQLAGLGWLRGVAVGWWLAGAALLALPGPWSLPALAAAFVALELVPALALRRREVAVSNA